MDATCTDSPSTQGLSPKQYEFVRLNAVMGIPTAMALADASEHVARGLCAGQGGMMDKFHCLTDRLSEFLEFVVLAEPLLADIDLQAAAAVAAFRQRLFAAIDSLQASLEDCEPQAVGDALTGGLAQTLGEYSGLGGNVAMAIRGVPLAA
jgi:hypothetical protein